MVLSIFWPCSRANQFEYGARSIFGKMVISSLWSYKGSNIDLDIDSNMEPGRYSRKLCYCVMCSGRRNHHFLDIQIGIRPSIWSERQIHYFPEYRPGSTFRSIFKSVFDLIHDRKDEITMFSNIDMARYSDRYSNRYSTYNMISKTMAPFPRISTWIDIHIYIPLDIRPTQQWR